jgi:hypothetical protein
MRDKFADLEEPKSRTLVGALLGLVFVSLFLAFLWSGSAPRHTQGIVQSSGWISVARIAGGTRQAASVRLSDGGLVVAAVVSTQSVRPGDSVEVLVEPRLLGPPAYQVVGKLSKFEP